MSLLRSTPADSSARAVDSPALRPSADAGGPLELWLSASRASALRMLRVRFARWPILGLDPEDVVAEASVAAIEGAVTLRARSAPGFRTWFHGICARRAIDALRRQSALGADRRRALAPDLAAELTSSEPEPAARLATRESLVRDSLVLHSLGSRDRSLLVLRELLRASWPTIARLGDWPSAEAARKAHERARARLGTHGGRCRA